MEFAKTELAAVANTANNFEEVAKELSDLELTMVGGGTGEVSLG